MSTPLQIDIVTIFPEMLEGFIGTSMLKRATQMQAVHFNLVNLRDFTTDRHRTVDDRPYGGGPGMIMKPEPFFKAVSALRTQEARVVMTSPQGKTFNQTMARELSNARHLIFLCGHYEGIDDRVAQTLVTDEISIGDYILTNGALAAAVIIDAVVRLLPGVLGAPDGTADESFCGNRLEYPQFTRPEVFCNLRVPEVLRSGDHMAIARWRADESRRRTLERRPDMLAADEDKSEN
ncbi:MAG: tRNA (guanosine(37)-N1)-methyltransferase TrmD [Kiritimatiellia bacterium]